MVVESSLPRSQGAESAVDIYYGRKKKKCIIEANRPFIVILLAHLLPYYNHLKAHAQ